ncbi:MAG: hypothetical protein FWH55_13910, partial [Oscillospiraceae bacterium]|nr:hypothetical protein [Oscillospiraceae bacterium]
MSDYALNLTMIAEEMAYDTFDIDEIVQYVCADFTIRTIKEELERLLERKASELSSNPDEVEQRLTELKKTLQKACGEQNVRNWLNGKPNRISRDSALKIAFALKMNEKEADGFLMESCWHDGFYMRDYKDVIYWFCLKHKLDYNQASELIDAYAFLDNKNPDAKKLASSGERMTDFLGDEAKVTSSIEELKSFIEQNQEYFGSFKRRAYEMFMEF